MKFAHCLALGSLLLALNAEAGIIDVAGTIAASDFLAEDDTGRFFYDAYDLSVTAPTTITVSMQANAGMQPWLAWWDHVVLPAFDWHFANPANPYIGSTIVASSTPGDLITMTSFTALPGVIYQLAASTLDYLPAAHLGDYVLHVDDGGASPGTVTLTALEPVPEPATLALVGLACVMVGHRRVRRFA